MPIHEVKQGLDPCLLSYAIALFTLSSRASICSILWLAERVKRSLAVFGGTVGGRIALTKNPLSNKLLLIFKALELEPTMRGCIALFDSSKLSPS